MAARIDPRPRRRHGVAVIVGLAVAIWLLTQALALLLPGDSSVSTPVQRPVATCDEPLWHRSPVPVTSAVLHGCPEQFDGVAVQVDGEAMGDLLRGPEGRRWVQVNDDAYAVLGPLPAHGLTLGTNSGVAVLLPVGTDVDVLGGPGVHGDLLAVTGTFYAAADVDQGGPAIDARHVEVLLHGGPVDVIPSGRLRAAALGAVVVTGMLGGALLHRHRHRHG